MTIVTKPNTFVANELIDANQMNQNFDSIYGSVNGSLDASNMSVNGLNDLTKFANEVVTQLKTKGLIYTQDLFSQSFFVSGGLATFPGSPLNQISVTTATAYIIQADGSYRRVVLTGTTYTTATLSATYYLDLQPDGTISWGTAHSGQTGYLSLATVTTNGSGNVSVVTDVRVLFAGISATDIANGLVSNAEFQFLDGVTSAIQTQLNTISTSDASKAPITSPTFLTSAILPANTTIGTLTATELTYLHGVTSALQTQLAALLSIATAASTYAPLTGINWTSRTSTADNDWRSVTYGNGLFVAVSSTGTGNRVMTSPDGITWTARVNPVDNPWFGVTYGNGLFVAVAATSGTGNRVMTSPDGINWTIRTSAADNDWNSVTYGNGLFVAVGTTGTGNRVMTSPDGITWTIRTSAADNTWTSVAYNNGLFVAVAASGTGNRVMTSPDGITWTIRTSAADLLWRSVVFGNGLYVAVSLDGPGNRVMTSPDGITWTNRTSAGDYQWKSVTYSNNLFVAVSVDGTGNIMTSPDGITWTLRASAVAAINWNSVTYNNGMFVAVAITGTGNRATTSGTLFLDISQAAKINAPNSFGRNIESQMQLKDYSEALTTYTGVTTTKTLDISLGNVFDITLTGAVTLTFSNPAASGQCATMTVLVRQDSTARVITFPASVLWPSGTVPVITTVSKTYVYTFKTVNGGTTWYGRMDGPY